jgi:hypothetical protein
VGLSFGTRPVTRAGVHRGAIHEKWEKETRVDIHISPRAEVDGTQKSAREKDSQEVKAV